MKHLTRIRVDLSHDWMFLKRRMGRRWLSSEACQGEDIVDLPHCWNAQDAFQENVSYYRGYGSYRKVFRMPENAAAAQNAVWSLESEGFYGTGDIWLNGHKLVNVDGQYLGFSISVGEHLSLDSDNIIGIRLTNRCRSHVLPGIKMPDFLLYGGLSGRVWLQGLPILHFDKKRTQLHFENVMGKTCAVLIHFTLANESSLEKQCRVKWAITDMNGHEVAGAELLNAVVKPGNDSGDLTVKLTVPNPQLWSPDSPNLYYAIGEILENDIVLDRVEERFGLREAMFKPEQGFFLNGQRLELRGCNRHESMPGFGRALPEKLHQEDAALIKKLGFNFVRLSHYPQHPCFLDACDELGLMVYAEIATWKSVRKGQWLKSACRQMHDMIIRDRNHPSIILWGMGNESRSRQAYLRLREIALHLDHSRPVTYAENHFYRAIRENTVGIPDIWAANYEFDALYKGHNASRLKCVIMSECANYPHSVRGEQDEETKQVAIIEDNLAGIETKPIVAGFALWCFNDYATLRKKRYKRHSGIVDAWRTPKMSSALMQAKYAKEPFVRIFGDWGSQESGVGSQGSGVRGQCSRGTLLPRHEQAGNREENASREIHIFTNCEKVTLSRNGEELCCLRGGIHYIRNVDFEPGELSATGVSNGERITDRLISFQEAWQIELLAEKTEANAAKRETIAITIRILDEHGHLVSSWKGYVKIMATGPAFLRSYRPDNAALIAGGTGRIFITGKGDKGIVSVEASCEELASGRASVQFG